MIDPFKNNKMISKQKIKMTQKLLEDEFLQKYYDAHFLTSKRDKKLHSILLQISILYPEENAIQVINSFLNDIYAYKDNPNNSGESKSEFLSFCHRYQFCGFSFLRIEMIEMNGVRKKSPRGYPNWKLIHPGNFEDHIFPHHQGFAFLTGRKSNITVIDCDTQDAYDHILRDFPHLAETLTVFTKQGAHIYCAYCPSISTSTRSFHTYLHVDIRNDGALVFAPPTSYAFSETELVTYRFKNLNAPILEFPVQLIADCKYQTPISTTLPADAKKGNNFAVNVESVEDLSNEQVNLLYGIFRQHVPHFVVRHPVITNGVFEIGYQEENRASPPIYYLKWFELCVLHTSSECAMEKLKSLDTILTFDVYVSTVEDKKTYHLYCVSLPIFHSDLQVAKLQQLVGVPLDEIKNSRRNGFSVNLLQQESFLGRFGNAPVMEDLVALVEMKNQLQQKFSHESALSQEHLQLLLEHHPFPTLKQFSLFITFEQHDKSSLPNSLAIH